MQRPPKFSVEELQGLRLDLAASVYNQATTQLLIYQRGLRLNAATTFDADRTATATTKTTATEPESRKSSLTTRQAAKGYSNNVQDKKARNMPSEKLLNEIKLERELATLRRIYAVAYEELLKDIKDEGDSSVKRGVSNKKYDQSNREKNDTYYESHNMDEIVENDGKVIKNGSGKSNERKFKEQRIEKKNRDDSDKNNEKNQEVKNDENDTENVYDKIYQKNFGYNMKQKDKIHENVGYYSNEEDKLDENDENTTGGHVILRAAIEAQKEDNNEEQQLIAELRHNQGTHKALRTQIDSESTEAAVRMNAKEERIETLRHNLRNVRRVNDLEVDLVERWEENRFTQATIAGENDERALLQQILALKQRLGGEQRIICEVQNFNAKQFAEKRTKIGEWKRKYADELVRKQAETLAQELRIAEVLKSHERHRQTYEDRRVFVSEYLAEKAEELRLYDAQMHRVECAVRIQAWWRGTMVRRGLGPYRKKSKKGKKGKAKGK